MNNEIKKKIMKNHYHTLGIETTATNQQIKEAYRKLSKKFHPDMNNQDKYFENMFKEILEAYETLSDDNKRKSYDIHFKEFFNTKKDTPENIHEQSEHSQDAKFIWTIHPAMELLSAVILAVGTDSKPPFPFIRQELTNIFDGEKAHAAMNILKVLIESKPEIDIQAACLQVVNNFIDKPQFKYSLLNIFIKIAPKQMSLLEKVASGLQISADEFKSIYANLVKTSEPKPEQEPPKPAEPQKSEPIKPKAEIKIKKYFKIYWRYILVSAILAAIILSVSNYYNNRVILNTIEEDPQIIQPTDEWFKQGKQAFENKEYSQAVIKLEKAVELNFSNADVFYYLGGAYFYQNDYNSAIKNYLKALELKPDFAEAYFSLGVAYFSNGGYDSAIECYKKYLELKPSSTAGYHRMGEALYSKGDYNAAIKFFQEVIEIEPNNGDAYCSLGNAYHAKKDDEKAKTYYQKSARLGNISAQEACKLLGISW